MLHQQESEPKKTLEKGNILCNPFIFSLKEQLMARFPLLKLLTEQGTIYYRYPLCFISKPRMLGQVFSKSPLSLCMYSIVRMPNPSQRAPIAYGEAYRKCKLITWVMTEHIRYHYINLIKVSLLKMMDWKGKTRWSKTWLNTHTHTYIDFEGKGIIDANKSIIGTWQWTAKKYFNWTVHLYSPLFRNLYKFSSFLNKKKVRNLKNL